jgi:hypothetical protein
VPPLDLAIDLPLRLAHRRAEMTRTLGPRMVKHHGEEPPRIGLAEGDVAQDVEQRLLGLGLLDFVTKQLFAALNLSDSKPSSVATSHARRNDGTRQLL